MTLHDPYLLVFALFFTSSSCASTVVPVSSNSTWPKGHEVISQIKLWRPWLALSSWPSLCLSLLPWHHTCFNRASPHTGRAYVAARWGCPPSGIRLGTEAVLLTVQEELNSAEKRHGLESGPCPAGPKMTVAQPVPWVQPVRDPEVEHPAEWCPDSCPKEAGRL